jgi:hypothetical protein
MGRKSKLGDAQWEEIGRRLAKGESTSALAKEYGVSKSVISARFSKRTETIKTVANQLVAAEIAFESLGIAEQISVRSLANELKDISLHLAGAAKFGAATAHRLSGIANAQVAKIDDADPLNNQSIESLKGISALTRLANESSTIGLNLLSANKEMVKAGMKDDPVQPVKIVVQVEDASIAEPEAE